MYMDKGRHRAEHTIRVNPCHPWFKNVFVIYRVIFTNSHALQYKPLDLTVPFRTHSSFMANGTMAQPALGGSGLASPAGRSRGGARECCRGVS